MKNILISLLICLFFNSCKEQESENKNIDLGPFSITVPNDFKYKPIRGIDSYVGEITNGTATFSFDYGMYSPKPPLTEEQYLEEKSESLDLDAFNHLIRLIDLTPYEDEQGSINPRDITKKIKNLKLNKTTADTKFSNSKNANCTYYYTFEFDTKQYTIPFFAYEKNLDTFKNYTINIDTINNFQRTISIWNEKDITKHHSVHLIPLNKDLSNYLFLGIPSNHKLSEELLKEILNSVTMKSKKDKF